MGDGVLLALFGCLTGIGLGMSARLGRFCSLGAIEDIVYGGRYYRLLMWPSAIGWAMLCIGLGIHFGVMDISKTLYLNFTPNYLAHISGGLTFGFGMALAGMCGFTGLARVGTGDMRAVFVIIVMGLASYVAASGLLAPLRSLLFTYTPNGDQDASIAMSLGRALGFSAHSILITLGIVAIALPLLRRNFVRSPYPLWALLVGFCIAGGWIATFWIAEGNLDATPVTSHTFSLPLGDTLLYAMTSTGSTLDFGIGSVCGMIIGGFIGAFIKGEFSWEACDDARELRRHILGAFLMGIGAVVGFGCSVGQGLSAMAVLYAGAPITLLAIIVGAYLGLRILVEG